MTTCLLLNILVMIIIIDSAKQRTIWYCRGRGKRIMRIKRQSKKREAILELLRSSNSHPGAQWIYDTLKPEYPDLSLGTVYRNISLFKKEVLVNFLGVVNGEERFDGTVDPHPHACCKKCGVILDLGESVSREVFRNFQVEIPGFAIDIRDTVFYGLCKKCTDNAAVDRIVNRVVDR